ncbi:MAG: ribosomal-processing cysteine protease Prp [Oscillospiraceae bacterium]
MIVLKVFKTPSGLVTGFEVNGHSGFGESGEDIVCAAVSSVAYMTANTITDIMNVDAKISVKDGYMRLELKRADAKYAQEILKGFEAHIQCLADDYPKNIKVKFGGVRNA